MTTPKAHKPTLAAALIAFLTALTALITALSAGGTTTISRQPAPVAQAKAAVAAAQAAPAPACNPAVGQGTLGACAPKASIALAAALARAAGQPVGFLNGPKGVDISSYQGCQNQ